MSATYFIMGCLAFVLSVACFIKSVPRVEEIPLAPASGTASNTELVEENHMWILVYSADSIMKNGIATKVITGTRSETLAERLSVRGDGGSVMLIGEVRPDTETAHPFPVTTDKHGGYRIERTNILPAQSWSSVEEWREANDAAWAARAAQQAEGKP